MAEQTARFRFGGGFRAELTPADEHTRLLLAALTPCQ
jgi:hypothetical protein